MKLISTGRFNIGYTFLILIVITGLFFASRYFFSEAYLFEYIQIDKLIMAIAFTLIFCYIVFILFKEYTAVDIFETTIKIKRFFGIKKTTIPIETIEFYSLKTKNKIDYIIIKTKNKSIHLNEGLTQNSFELTAYLKENNVTRRDNYNFNQSVKKKLRIESLCLMSFSVVLFVGFIILLIKGDSPIDKDSLTKISGHLRDQVSVQKPLKSSGYIDFNISEYPDIKFEILSPGYNIIDLKKIREYKFGTLVEILIPKREYELKILKKETPSFSEKHFSWNKIYAYGINMNSTVILSLENYNARKSKTETESGKSNWFFFLLLIFLFLYGLKTYPK